MSPLGAHGNRLVLLLVAALVLVGALAIPLSRGSSSPASQVSPATPAIAQLDLAAMALSPDDLAAAGLPGYGEYAGAMLTLEEQAKRTAPDLGLDATAVEASLRAAGFVRRYQRELALSADPGTPEAKPHMSVTSYITQYSS